MMKKMFSRALIAATLVCSLSAGSFGQPLLIENFDYVPGTQLLANGWSLTNSTTNPILVSSSGLTYPWYPSSGIGNAAAMVSTGQDVYRGYSPQTTGDLYAGFMVSVSAAQTAGDYFFHFTQDLSTSIFKARVYIKKDPLSENFAFGISKSSTTSTILPAYTGYNYSLNTTYLLVVKYQFLPGANDDVVYLYVDPPMAQIEPAVPTLMHVDNSTNSDAANLGRVGLRQGSTTNAATLTIDGIRISTAYPDVVGAPPIPTLSEWALIVLGLALLGIGSIYILRIKG